VGASGDEEFTSSVFSRHHVAGVDRLKSFGIRFERYLDLFCVTWCFTTRNMHNSSTGEIVPRYDNV